MLFDSAFAITGKVLYGEMRALIFTLMIKGA
jgi:hypothetical protein